MSSARDRRMQLSQNFLKDPRLVAALLDRFHVGRDGTVYEIGPGEGIITEQLARRYRQVVAIEKDPCLAGLLRRRFSERLNVTIHEGDFLRYRLPCSPYAVVANIPFNITSDIMAKLTEAGHAPDVAYLVMQAEAASMFAGYPRESLRTVLLKPWFEAEIVHRFQRSDFAPAPRVDVVMLRLRKRGPPLVSARDRQLFRDFAVYVFTHWQASHRNPLTRLFTRRQLRQIKQDLGYAFDTSLISPTSLTCVEWLRLFDHLKAVASAETLTILTGSERRLRQQQARLPKTHRTRVGRRKL